MLENFTQRAHAIFLANYAILCPLCVIHWRSCLPAGRLSL